MISGEVPKILEFWRNFQVICFFFPLGFEPHQVAILSPDLGAVAVTGHSKMAGSKSQLGGVQNQGGKKSKSTENLTEILVFRGVSKKSVFGRLKCMEVHEICQKRTKIIFFEETAKKSATFFEDFLWREK